MALSVSLGLFKGLPVNEEGQAGRKIARCLFAFKDEANGPKWICSYRTLIGGAKELASAHTVPNYLQPCGVLTTGIDNDDELKDLLPSSMLGQELHVFKWDPEKEDNPSLQEAVQCFVMTLQNGKCEMKEVPATDITWIEDDMAEVGRRGYTPIATSLLATVPLNTSGDVELSRELLGPKKIEVLPQPLRNAATTFLREQLVQFLDVQNEALSMDLTDIPIPRVATNGSEPGYAHLTFGATKEYKKHALIYTVPREEEAEDESIADLQVVLQTTCVAPTEIVGDEPTEELAEVTLQALRHVATLSFGSESLLNQATVYINSEERSIVKDAEQDVTVSKSPSKGKGNAKGGKGKSASSRSKKPAAPKPVKTQESSVVALVKSEVPVEISIGDFTRNVYLTVNLDKVSGKINVGVSNAADNAKTDEIEKVKISIISKAFVPSEDMHEPVFPFGSATFNLLGLMQNADGAVAECVTDTNPASHLKLLFSSKELCDRNVLISPHLDCAMFPQWISNKTSKASLVKGLYQYYHYLQGGKNDSGWGCCYRSIQMVASWYLLQYHTIRPVPTHDEIQKYLQEKDPSHVGMVVGSATWIGTVEAGYFINWYLKYDAKTFYLSDVNDFRNYNSVIANHFQKVGSPIIMGAGMFAYVILGICMGAQTGDVAYLIADPHYVGEDSIKSIKTKGAMAWKKIDFISKAANGSFINLCCPQLDRYDD
ncbi:peptidase family protein c78 [Babesia ovata]|uniref:Peptidase family protein c78 n=1 Tax=Babesia ovata TaxID=189622 RepID=A0A2H6K6K9_9APIC|nr:peptidase family protein c78 [Babesia ovata]GBE58625.1 peptidase family protein c78 [Babesia ovata]